MCVYCDCDAVRDAGRTGAKGHGAGVLRRHADLAAVGDHRGALLLLPQRHAPAVHCSARRARHVPLRGH